jgi:thiamine-phosphate diphosphorylase
MSRLRGIYAIVDKAATRDPEALCLAVLRAGVRLVQYRAKDGVERALLRRMHAAVAAFGGLLIVNDDLDAAADADGLHVGQEDLAALGRDVRERLAGRILGVSCGTPAEVAVARAAGADYVGAGPFATTSTKADAGAPIGSAGVAGIVAVAGELPVAAVGGIGLSELSAVAASGAKMAAIISAIASAPNPELRASALVARWIELDR